MPDKRDRMTPKTPAEFEYLIRKTVTYLQFHDDDAAKEIAAQWQQVLQQIQMMKRQAKKAGLPPKSEGRRGEGEREK